jgi:hypothetical protein
VQLVAGHARPLASANGMTSRPSRSVG